MERALKQARQQRFFSFTQKLAGIMRYGLLFRVALLVASLVVSQRANADELDFERDVRPILAEYCFACHGPDAASREADLRLDDRDSAIDMGAIEPGDPDSSELISRLITDDPDAVMPPPSTKKHLTPEQIETLKQWIADGAQYELHWAFRGPEKPESPKLENDTWSKSAIDGFVLKSMREHGLEPNAEATPRQLFRRIHFDITGLPPTPVDVDSFVADYEANHDEALSAWIDKLMARPEWGEHRGRYWLDAARYGDTHGMHFDNYREMWPYRDWVIRAFNQNQPFDQFTKEQIAGDLFDQPTEDQLVATGFQRCNITTNEGGTIEEENLALYAADRVQTISWVYMGVTMNCCQCHDHKFDPFTMRDYYSMAAFFRNTTQTGLDGNSKDGRSAVVYLPREEDRDRWVALPAEIAAAEQAVTTRRETAKADYESWIHSLNVESILQSLPVNGMVAHFPIDEGRGNETKAKVGSINSAQFIGDAEWTNEGKRGPAAILRPGKTIEIGDIGNFELNEPFSFGAWIKTADKNTFGGIIARMDEGKEFRGWDLWQNGGTFAVHFVDAWPGNALKVRTKTDVVRPGEWQHVFVTYDGSTKPDGIRIFINGVEAPKNVDANTLQTGASIKSETPLRIGQRSVGQHFNGGSVQDFQLFDRSLSGDEVSRIAKGQFLIDLLSKPRAEWSEEQKKSIYEHFLVSVDTEYPQFVNNRDSLQREYTAIRDRSPLTHVQREKADSSAMANVLMRGEYDRKGDEVEANAPGALPPLPSGAPKNRLGLAEWLVADENPLTARVTVNRFWQQLFGTGIVPTAEDFGVMGMPPSNPELLDWLAVDFREHGWDVKRFFKQVLMSATYRQSAVVTPEKLEIDPQNQWLSHGPRFRMDAEMIRDAALAESGLLSKKMFGPSVKPYQPEHIWDVVGLPEGNTRNYQQSEGEDLYRRSLYTFWKRMAPPPNMESLNAPSREVCVVKRERTNTPLQALVTLNDPIFFESAVELARSLMADQGNDSTRIIRELGQRVLSRDFTDAEQAIIVEDLAAYQKHYSENPEDALAIVRVAQTESSTDAKTAAELAAWSMVCNSVLNLDESLNK
ncbi:MAG: DUF1553 domain-containing protein [Pirellulaceae bacterium]